MMQKLLICVLLMILCACSSSETPKGETQAEVLYKSAQKLVDEGHYTLATEKLNNLRSKYPYSFFSTHAELLQADILYLQESFAEAAAAYVLFRDMHPRHEKVSYVTWRIGESFYKQIDTIDRDLAPAKEAIKYYEEVINRFPSKEYNQQARDKIKECSDMLMQKEKYVADFYYKTEVYDSARYRYLSILRSFKDQELVDHSVVRVALSSKYLGEGDKCLNYISSFMDRVSSKAKKKLNSIKETCK